MDKQRAPEATRYTLNPAPGLKVSDFGIGLRSLLVYRESETGERYPLTRLATDANVHVETVRRVLFGVGTFEASTLAGLSRALGIGAWEYVSVLGNRAALLASESIAAREAMP